MPPDRVSASVASFDFLYLSELSKRGLTAPSVGANEVESDVFGGTVLAPEPGVFDNVLVFDFKSLYPSIIRTFEIDPLGYLGSGPGQYENAVIAPNGAAMGLGCRGNVMTYTEAGSPLVVEPSRTTVASGSPKRVGSAASSASRAFASCADTTGGSSLSTGV